MESWGNWSEIGADWNGQDQGVSDSGKFGRHDMVNRGGIQLRSGSSPIRNGFVIGQRVPMEEHGKLRLNDIELVRTRCRSEQGGVSWNERG